MSREIKDWDNLTDEDKAFLRMRGNAADLARAGLLDEQVDYGLSGTPGSLQEYELKGEGQPTNDMESEVAKASEGSEPGGDPVVTRVPDPTPPAPVDATAAKQTPQKAPTKASTKA